LGGDTKINANLSSSRGSVRGETVVITRHLSWQLPAELYLLTSSGQRDAPVLSDGWQRAVAERCGVRQGDSRRIVLRTKV
jgi:hypothetical protein